jgi:diguanylate cyclase (GGDEF)-like protein
LNIQEARKLCGKNASRGKLPANLIEILGNSLLDNFPNRGRDATIILAFQKNDFPSLTGRWEAVAAPGLWFRKARQWASFPVHHFNPFLLVIADPSSVVLLLAQKESEPLPTIAAHPTQNYDVLLSNHPLSIQRVLHHCFDKPKKKDNSNGTGEFLEVLKSIPDKSRGTLPSFLGLNAAQVSAQQLDKSQRSLSLLRFQFELEEKLGDIYNPSEIIQTFSDLFKQHLHYDYLEVSFLTNEQPPEFVPTNWVRNDTGLGGKLLSIILKENFNQSLTRRKLPLIIDAGNGDQYINNPDLLGIMSLRCGALIPLIHRGKAYGVMKVFFDHEALFDEQLREWLGTVGEILARCLIRAWKYLAAEKMATIDGLTGLYNHRYFMDQLQKEFTRARRYRNWLSLILIDVDYFKHYNDSNGHLAGDRGLRKIARIIRSSVREIDLVARWGGEEFALLLPEINLENSMIVAEKIRREVESQKFANEKQQPGGQLTISLGIASNLPELKNYREMFNMADIALYQAKQGGRNRCIPAK